MPATKDHSMLVGLPTFMSNHVSVIALSSKMAPTSLIITKATEFKTDFKIIPITTPKGDDKELMSS